jgi:hypothetical protein
MSYTLFAMETEMSQLVVVVKRAIPVSDCSTDTVTGIFNENETLANVMAWVEKECSGSTVLISIELTKPRGV